MAGNIIGVIGQRLVRRLCEECKSAYSPSRMERQVLRLGIAADDASKIYKADGCRACDHTGYRGRMALTELLRFDPEIDELVARRTTAREVLTLARSKGYRTLADDGIRRVVDGTTSMDEIARVLDLTEGI